MATTEGNRIRVGRAPLADLWEASCGGCGDSHRDASQHELRIWTARHARGCRALPFRAAAEAVRELHAMGRLSWNWLGRTT